MNYYRRYIGDYMRDTASLSLAEHGAYNLLLDHAYATERPIPGDLDEVMRLVRAFTEEERRAVEKVLSRFWVLSDDGFQNDRVIEEIEKASHLIEKQKANGKLGGRPKKAKQEPNGNPTVIPSDNPNGKPNGTQNNQPPTTNIQPPYKDKSIVGLKPDVARLREQAASIIEALNKRTGRNYGLNGANADHVVARLKDGASVDLCLAVIDLKAKEWSGDENMAKYLRPETLFNRTKFATYSGEVGAAKPHELTSTGERRAAV